MASVLFARRALRSAESASAIFCSPDSSKCAQHELSPLTVAGEVEGDANSRRPYRTQCEPRKPQDLVTARVRPRRSKRAPTNGKGNSTHQKLPLPPRCTASRRTWTVLINIRSHLRARGISLGATRKDVHCSSTHCFCFASGALPSLEQKLRNFSKGRRQRCYARQEPCSQQWQRLTEPTRINSYANF